MATFQEAIQWLKEGKKVSRTGWSEEYYWQFNIHYIMEIFDINNNSPIIKMEDIEAKDWFIWEDYKWVLMTNFEIGKFLEMKVVSMVNFKMSEYIAIPLHGLDTKSDILYIDRNNKDYKFENGKLYKKVK